MSFTFADLFCGAGGSISGLVDSGAELVLGANHSAQAIETVSSNYRDADFLCTDINHYDMRRLPKTQVLWASVICTEISPAGGNKKHRGQGSLDLEEYGHVPSEAYERTRACALDVIRATEIHRYDAVVVENVIEFARDWELYDWWVEGVCRLRPGYNAQVVNVSAAHVYDNEGNDPAPQWRDRLYIVFTKKGIPLPDLEPRPPSWCWSCEDFVAGLQSWKKVAARKIGKYGPQYNYRCPACTEIVEPLVLPAIAALDMDDVGQRIGDRKKPLAENTIARIEWGIRTFWGPVVAQVAGNTYERPGSGYHRVIPAEGAPLTTRQTDGLDAVIAPTLLANANHDDARVTRADTGPLPTRTSKIGEVVVTPPVVTDLAHGGHHRRSAPAGQAPIPALTVDPSLVIVNRTNNRPRAADDEALAPITTGENQALITTARRNSRAVPAGMDSLATVTGQGRHHELVHPPLYVKNFTGDPADMVRPADSNPLGTITTKDHHGLVIPYRRGKAKTTSEPLHTIATVEGEAVLQPGDDLPIDVEDCFYRMLHPREHLRAQRFADSYVVMGNRGEQTLQAGNAVPCNVAQWIGRQLAEVLA